MEERNVGMKGKVLNKAKLAPRTQLQSSQRDASPLQ